MGSSGYLGPHLENSWTTAKFSKSDLMILKSNTPKSKIKAKPMTK
jgi:hypothetical protein